MMFGRRVTRELPPPEQAQSHEDFCASAAKEQSHCRTSSWSGWNLIACLGAAFPGWIAIFFFISLTDPGPAWWQWVGAFGFFALTLWIFSFPMRAAARDTPRYQEIAEMWRIWRGWLQREEVPTYRWEVEGFTGPNGARSPTWRIWPDGEEASADKPLRPEQASTDEQFRCRVAYETGLCLSRPWLGARGGNFVAWVVLIVAVILTAVFSGRLAQPDPSSQEWLGAVGFAVLALVALSLPVRAFYRDVPRYFELRRLRNHWEAQYPYETDPPPPPPPEHPFNADLYPRL